MPRSFAQLRAAQFVGAATRLNNYDLPRIGHQIGVGEDEIHAVIEVETRGGGFNPQSQPKILFEPHLFYKHLSGTKREQAVAAGLAYASWRAGAYGPESAQYGKLMRAIAIDETAALKSCSWGLGQVLGENYVAAGYTSVQAMVVDAVEGGEAAHLQMMINFIKANHLDDEIRSHNWAAFARGYNGPKYAVNGYHTKLAAAFAKWQLIKDTVWSPAMDVGALKSAPQASVAPPVVTTPPAPTAKPVSGWSKLGSLLSSLFVKK